MPRCYGRLPARHDPRMPRFAAYATPQLPAPPDTVDWTKAVSTWPMMKNDQIGDCTCAAAGHMIECWSANARGMAQVPADQQIVAAYSAITGYDSVTGAGDNGAVELDVLDYWQKTGIAGNQVSAFVAVDWTNTEHVKQAISLFGGLYLGLNIPQSAEEQIENGQPWEPSGPFDQIVGGHAVPALAYDQQYLTVITWGQTQLMGWDFLSKYCEEAYAIVDPAWVSDRSLPWYERLWGTPVSPGGFDLEQLTEDLATLRP
jgi:hypothetical protein